MRCVTAQKTFCIKINKEREWNRKKIKNPQIAEYPRSSPAFFKAQEFGLLPQQFLDSLKKYLNIQWLCKYLLCTKDHGYPEVLIPCISAAA